MGVAKDGPVIATANVHGHARVLGRGRIRNHRVTLTLTGVHRGRYSVTLLAPRAHRAPVVIGHTTLVIT
jgi:hypothetical protein